MEPPTRPYSPQARAALAQLLTLVSLGLGVSVFPVAVLAEVPLLGVGLAAVGLLFGVCAAGVSLLRRGAGLGFVCVALLLCGAGLYGSILLGNRAGGFWKPDEGSAARVGAPEEPPGEGTDAGDDEGRETPPPRRGNPPVPPQGQTGRPPAPPLPSPADPAWSSAKLLASEDVEDRIRAANQLARMGPKGKAAARALCEAALEDKGEGRQAALEALEKVHPELYKHVLVLLVDQEFRNHVNASQGIGRLKEEGAPALPILLDHIQKCLSDQREPPLASVYNTTSLLDADLRALVEIAPNNQEVWKCLVDMLKSEPGHRLYSRFEGARARTVAAECMTKVGKDNSAARSVFVPPLIKATNVTIYDQRDKATCLAAIRTLGSFGPAAKDAVPTLKKLKIDTDERIRRAASQALEAIGE
jgi:hypothetical protein